MADLAVLRTAKAALDEALITAGDYETVKHAFLRAQQIKAGVDAGFIQEAEYVNAKKAFLHALEFQYIGSPVPAPGFAMASAALEQPTSSGRTSHPGFQPSNGHNTAPAAAAAPPARAPPPPPPPPPQRPSVNLPPAPQPPAPAPAAAPAAALPGNGGVPPDLAAQLASMRKGLAGKKSMSGIVVHEDCVNLFNLMRTKSVAQWATFRVDDAGREVQVERVGAKGEQYSQFLAALPADSCRYGVFDYFVTSSHGAMHKLVALSWAPDNAPARTKMMYASTKEAFTSCLDGVHAILAGSEISDIDEAAVEERVKGNMTRQ